MTRHSRRSLPAALVALVLLAVCVLVAVSAIQFLLGEQPLLTYDSLTGPVHAVSWTELPVVIGGGAAVVLGLTLFLMAVIPGKPTVMPLVAADSGAVRHSLRRTLRTSAAGVDGVASVKLKLRRKKVIAKVRTNRTNAAGLAEAVRDAVGARLDRIGPVARPSVRVRVASVRSKP
jgi:hypothetical protein